MALTRLLPFFFIAIASADILKNPDFESPPTNMTANGTSPFLLQKKVNTIPGWSFNGTVRYITSGPNISLPGNGHGIQLGKGGKINQTFIADDNYANYVLTFSLAPGNKNCFNKTIAVNVSAPGILKGFSLQRRYGKEMWESHACSLGAYGLNDIVNLKIQSASVDMDANDTCSPIVDTFMIRAIGGAIYPDTNRLYNGGFEMGPAFLENSTEGILLNDEQYYLVSSLDHWSVIGTVKYINTKYYSVPEGKAAVELLSSAIQRHEYLTVGFKYTLKFTIGDANDSCLGEFIVYAQVSNDIHNFTLLSNGKGSFKEYSLTFTAMFLETTISFASYNLSKSSDNVLCGPVIDKVILLRSYGLQHNVKSSVLFLCLFFILTLHSFV